MPPASTLHRAIFLDRDDTVNRNADLPDCAWENVKWGDLLKPQYALLIEGSRDALIALKDAGYKLIIITNQGGVARGGGTLRDVDAVNDQLRSLLNPDQEPCPIFGDQLIDCWYSCPFHPQGTNAPFNSEHDWRKPNPGMISAAAREHNIDLESSFMIGDKQRDLDAAIGAGVPASQTIQVGPNADCPDLAHAARTILNIDHTPKPTTSVTLRALDASSRPLSDERTRSTVESAARALAERTGITLSDLSLSDDAVTATLAIHQLGALAFMAELRRTTNSWHAHTHGSPLWTAHH
jgi:D-glycero-D-manno-heptose 1,7-bisphosphate phosphatase